MRTCGIDMMKHGPVPPVTQLHGREEDGVEVNVVLAHELEELNVLRVEPPLLPSIRKEVGGDTGIAERSVEPNV
jgi:hypothetical protein